MGRPRAESKNRQSNVLGPTYCLAKIPVKHLRDFTRVCDDNGFHVECGSA